MTRYRVTGSATPSGGFLRTLMSGLAGGALLFGGAAAAQDDATGDESGARQQRAIEEIVVTAQRREQALEDVPIAVSGLNADELQSRGIENIGQMDAVAPGLQISKTPSNTTISQISIRGITQINPAIYWDPAVGVYLDGVYIGKSQGSIFDLVNLESVEVLRGPQGTLYGRNTLAGAINLRTQAPQGVFSGRGSLEVGNYDSMVQKVNLSLPEMAGLRIAIGARMERRDGWIDTTRASSVETFNDRNNDGMRLAVDYDVTPDLLLEYRFDRSYVDQTNNFTQLHRVSAEFPAFSPGAPFEALPSFASRERQESAAVNAPSYEVAEIGGHSLTLTWDVLDDFSIKSITGYRSMDWRDSLDLDGSPLPVALTQRFTDYDQISQDIQFLGRVGIVEFVGGLYYFGDDGETENPQEFFGGAQVFDSQYATRTDAWAGYGQLDFLLTDAVTATLGARYTRETKELDRRFGVAGSPGGDFLYLIPEGTSAEETFSDTTPVAALNWRVTERFSTYLRYAEGFKSGGFNGEFSQPPTGAEGEDIAELIALNIAETKTPFKPEKQRSYEAGFKSRFDRLRLSGAVFHNELEDLQTSIFLGSGAAATVIRNAGEATIDGFELEGQWLIGDFATFSFNYTFLDADYDEYIDAGVDQADNRAFVHAPDHAFNIVLDSDIHQFDFGVLRATVDYSWTDAFFTYPYQLSGPGEPGYNPAAQVAENSEVEAHGILNARLSMAELPLGNGAFGEVALWVRNALDEDAATNFIDFGPGFGGLTIANFREPRTFGVVGVVRW
ncbi:TonB-dependent receptor [Algiphilus sp.]|uniref:TonB-dependent receptor n=1 Tax=Algiphilus sp. TaxID=1872431 RepID=UPI0025BD856A|nr:TonB-dependent receptor [Algiphilus sp.]